MHLGAGSTVTSVIGARSLPLLGNMIHLNHIFISFSHFCFLSFALSSSGFSFSVRLLPYPSVSLRGRLFFVTSGAFSYFLSLSLYLHFHAYKFSVNVAFLSLIFACFSFYTFTIITPLRVFFPNGILWLSL